MKEILSQRMRWCRLELDWKGSGVTRCHEPSQLCLAQLSGKCPRLSPLLSLPQKPSALSSEAPIYKMLIPHAVLGWEWLCHLPITWNEGQRRCFSSRTEVGELILGDKLHDKMGPPWASLTCPFAQLCFSLVTNTSLRN